MFQRHHYETLIIIADDEPQLGLFQTTTQFNYSNNYKTTATTTDVIPKLILTQDSLHGFESTCNLNSKFLIVLSIPAHTDDTSTGKSNKILEKFLKIHPKTLNMKIVVLMKSLQPPSKRDLKDYFLYFKKLQLYDVLVIPIKTNELDIFYTYTVLPRLEILTRQFNTLDSSEYFVAQIGNLQQHPLLTYPDQLQPRTLLHYDKKGQIKMLGYIGRLISTYAQKINASIKFPFPLKINNPLFFTDVLQMTLNGSLDIPASIACPNEVEAMKYFSRFIEVGKWFPMLPVADYMIPMDIYYKLLLQDFGSLFIIMLIIYSLFLLLIELLRNLTESFTSILHKSLINQQVFLGLLGSSFKMRHSCKYYKSYKFLLILIQFTGFMMTIFSNTYLTSNITTPPKYPEINSLDHLQKHNLKILMLQHGLNLLDLYVGDELKNKYISSIYVIRNVSEFIELRNNFNKSAAYAVSSSLWSIYEKQQMYFSEKIVRYSKHLYFSNLMIYALPLPANSIFERSLNKFIGELLSAGILQHWYKSSFYDMIETGHMSFRDMSNAREYNKVQFGDFKILWLVCASGLMASCLVFIIELIVYKLKLNTHK
ncbi:uncharacterized protein LOC135961533 [Calliphora vicina]|uniref:uncharacterized protein LOC135961533 n=1 Tax=Calliphora vicina TaxID=7373 RepID=UPI00325BC4AA